MCYWLCHKAFFKDRRRTWQKDHMSDKAVDGSLNHGARGRRAGLAIDPKHVLIFPKANGRVPDVAESSSTKHDTHMTLSVHLFTKCNKILCTAPHRCGSADSACISCSFVPTTMPPYLWKVKHSKKLGGWGEVWGGEWWWNWFTKEQLMVISCVIEHHWFPHASL